EWLNQCNILIGVQKEKELIFTNVGRVIALMMYHNKVIDILDTAKEKIQEINPVKIFGNIVSGQLVDNAIVFFSTELILDYLSKEKIKRMLVDNTPQEAVDEFFNLLSPDTNNSNFAALIVQRTKPQQEIVQTTHTIKPENYQNEALTTKNNTHSDSMAELMGKQAQTEEFLTSSIWPSFKKRVQQRMESFVERYQKPINESKEHTMLPMTHSTQALRTQASNRPAMQHAPHTATTVITRIGKIIGQILFFVFNLFKRCIVWIMRALTQWWNGRKHTSVQSHRKNTIHRLPRIQGMASTIFARIVRWFTSLTTIQKTFFIVAIIVLLIFAQSVINRDEKKTTKTNEDQYAQTLSTVDLKINEGKAKLLYDTDAARLFFIEARTTLEQIPKDSTSYQERGTELENVISAQLKRLNKVITVENPTSVVDFSTANADASVGNMILLGASIYGFDKKTLLVYRSQLENKETSTVDLTADGDKTFTEAVKVGPGLGVVQLSDQSFAFFNPIKEALSSLTLNAPEKDQQIVDLFLFGQSRLYSLDVKNNQIYRYQKSGEAFSSGSRWITESGVDLHNAVSLAIDGDVYILNNTGEIIKFSAGKKNTGFSVSSIDPTLTSGDSIYTDENTKNLYVLDAKNQRIVVLTKEGTLFAQYTSSAFSDLQDMIIDEANKKMYILNGSTVYEVQLQDAEQIDAAQTQSNG
ncbi:MAG TPA: hypothetical protein VJB65_04160, partial [Patescibacteria group bacterium]|nr:hypothetical protein [Patescibacteria group bacterium]